MRGRGSRIAVVAGIVSLILAAGLPNAGAIHWYRSDAGGCAPADGNLTDDPEEVEPNVTATVVVGHNTFSEGDFGTGFSVSSLTAPVETRIVAGESVTWTWNSAHCHSVTSSDYAPGTTDPLFDSGFLYPATPPESPRVAPGLFEYPLLDDTPTLSYTHTFTEPGTYAYYCVHHASIGMTGVVIVAPAA